MRQCIVTLTPRSEQENLERYFRATNPKYKWAYSRESQRTKSHKISRFPDQDSETYHLHRHHQSTLAHPLTATGDQEEEAAILEMEIGTLEDVETDVNKTIGYLRRLHKALARGLRGSGN